ncbi:hypothetical protein V5O48_019495, partial [Marasmius crinis-equi]
QVNRVPRRRRGQSSVSSCWWHAVVWRSEWKNVRPNPVSGILSHNTGSKTSLNNTDQCTHITVNGRKKRLSPSYRNGFGSMKTTSLPGFSHYK